MYIRAPRSRQRRDSGRAVLDDRPPYFSRSRDVVDDTLRECTLRTSTDVTDVTESAAPVLSSSSRLARSPDQRFWQIAVLDFRRFYIRRTEKTSNCLKSWAERSIQWPTGYYPSSVDIRYRGGSEEATACGLWSTVLPIAVTAWTPIRPLKMHYYWWTLCRRLIRSARSVDVPRGETLARPGRDLRDAMDIPSVPSGYVDPDRTNPAPPDLVWLGVVRTAKMSIITHNQSLTGRSFVSVRLSSKAYRISPRSTTRTRRRFFFDKLFLQPRLPHTLDCLPSNIRYWPPAALWRFEELSGRSRRRCLSAEKPHCRG